MTAPTLWDIAARSGSAFPTTLQEQFDAWLESPDGLRVYWEVVSRARALKALGFQHYGIRAIWEAIRFDWSVKVGPDRDGFKVNDHHHSRMARRVMADCPDLADFFETRTLRAA